MSQNFPNIGHVKIMNHFRQNPNFILLCEIRTSQDYSIISLLAGRMKSKIALKKEDYEYIGMAIGMATYGRNEEDKKRAKQYIDYLLDLKTAVLDLETKLITFEDDFQF